MSSQTALSKVLVYVLSNTGTVNHPARVHLQMFMNCETPNTGCIVMLFVWITIMLGFSFIQYTNTWLSHKAFFITRDMEI